MNINFNIISSILKSFQARESAHARNNQAGSFNAPNSGLSRDTVLFTQQSLNINVQVTQLTRQQEVVLIKELLNLPKEYLELLSLLTNTDPANTAQVFQQDTQILLKDIKALLESNSKEVINKLLKLMQTYSGNIQSLDQLKGLISILNQIIPGTKTTQPEILKDLILLYLPWLPLTQQQNIALEFEERKRKGAEEEDIALVVFISTQNLDRFKVTIGLGSGSILKIDIENQSKDPNIKPYLEEISKAVEQELLSNKIPAKAQFYVNNECETGASSQNGDGQPTLQAKAHSYTVKEEKQQSQAPIAEPYQVTKQEERSKEENKDVSLQATKSVSPKVMMAAHAVIRIIFEFDDKISLANNRKGMIK